MNVTSISTLVAVIGALVVIVNLLTEVIKKSAWNKLPTNIVVVVLSVALTMAVFFAYCQIRGIAVIWYMVVAALVGGFMVAYGAMFGSDKLKEALAQITIGEITGNTNKTELKPDTSGSGTNGESK
ncbi:hypothetical protein OBV_22660 [Oscillibacter valericigenes Sjm18-20]|nr:hypothetical protein OBV_22660 [Oscillibacter valericigenes Sjm18-20]